MRCRCVCSGDCSGHCAKDGERSFNGFRYYADRPGAPFGNDGNALDQFNRRMRIGNHATWSEGTTTEGKLFRVLCVALKPWQVFCSGEAAGDCA